MMILITPSDFSKLSVSCRQELLAALTSYGPTSRGNMNATDFVSRFGGACDDGGAGLIKSDGETLGAPLEEPLRKTSRSFKKKTVEIDVEQVSRLISNISPRSQKTLAEFMNGDWISISSLVGPDKDYPDLMALKKSFVGAVNRRLRTVTGDRAAVLFSANSDRSAIHIGPMSAAALRQVLNAPEPQLHGFQVQNKEPFDDVPPEK